ncbi:MAG: SirA family protein [Desulfovibrionaceae bacterium CG1_02_65_16]|nr:MAG: SirA family protein [Desulfovibrionaceae bacterium CG1_02_65_16]
MSTIILDCRGLACPGPVLRCLECLKSDPASLAVQVDDAGALENVTRLLSGKGFAVTSAQENGAWTISASRDASAAAAQTTPTGDAAACCPAGAAAVSAALGPVDARTTVFITTEHLGRGDDELGGKLMFNFLGTLPELGDRLWRIVLVNGAVRLACEGHSCLEKLEALAAAGVSVLVCGTCLGFFGLMEKKKVGETTNMLDVVTSLDVAGKVIKI